MISGNKLDDRLYWANEPQHDVRESRLYITTSPETDFWQRTHYGFRRDNGHCLFVKVDRDFSLSVKTTYNPNDQYDQAGLMVRIDGENWIKTSVEYENEELSRLGSVVTNFGFSDWATIDISSRITDMWYRIQSSGNDYLLEFSEDGTSWKQLRVAHLHKEQRELEVGIYACSPMKSSFEAVFQDLIIGESSWQ